MSELQSLIDTPIGGVFFVSGTISVFVILAVLILKKGSDLHSVLGYIYFFALGFSNYAATMSYYEGLLPLAAISVTVPISTIFLIIGLISIIPTKKSLFAIRLHIIAMCTSSTAVFVGTVINWYHFKLNPITAFKWNDFGMLLILCAPFIIAGGLLAINFLSEALSQFNRIHNVAIQENLPSKLPNQIQPGARAQTILKDKSTGITKENKNRREA